jgi:hypothetical protein
MTWNESTARMQVQPDTGHVDGVMIVTFHNINVAVLFDSEPGDTDYEMASNYLRHDW